MVYQKSFVSLQVKITNNINLKTKVMNNETELSAQSAENIQKMYVKIIEYLKGYNYDVPTRIVVKGRNKNDIVMVVTDIHLLRLRSLPSDKYGTNYELYVKHGNDTESIFLSEMSDITLIYCSNI